MPNGGPTDANFGVLSTTDRVGRLGMIQTQPPQGLGSGLGRVNLEQLLGDVAVAENVLAALVLNRANGGHSCDRI